MDTILSRLRLEIRNIFRTDSGNQAKVSSMTVYRFTETKIHMPSTENSYLYLVLDGTLRLYTPSGIMDYMAGQYSISKIDTPLHGTILAFSEQNDFLAIALELPSHEVIAAVLDLDNTLTERIMNEAVPEQEMSLADNAVIESVYRLFVTMRKPLASDYMRRNIMREVIYYVLYGSCGKQFLQAITNIQNIDEIYKANSWIKENFRSSFTVESLAEQQNMSVSLFHQKFKSAVGMGPLQCQKRLRLTEARRRMLDESRNVTEASLEVGYESVSHFIREYRKMFGAAPKEDVSRFKEQLKK